MKLKVQNVTVEVQRTDETEVLQLALLNPDICKAEREAPRVGVPVGKKGGINFLTCAAWATAVRTGVYDGKLRDWLDRDCLVLDPADVDEVPPTEPAADTDSP